MADRNLGQQNQSSKIFNGSNPLNNGTNPDDLVLSEIENYIYMILFPTISFMGIVGNLSSFMILLRLSNLSSFYMYLACLSLSDVVVLSIGGIYRWLMMTVLSFETNGPIVCSVPFAFLMLFSALSAWITATVSVDRYIAVYYPFKVNQYCTRKRALIFVVLAFLLLLAINFPTICYEWNDDNSSCITPEFTNDYCLEYINYIDLSGYVAIPFCFICIFNILIIRGIYNAATQRRRLTSVGHRTTSIIKESTKRTVKVLFVVTTFFTVCYLPFAVASFYGIFYGKSWFQVKEQVPLADAIIHTAILMNHAFNFVLYGVSGQQFREDIVALFCCRRALSR
ncbi:FMRFamide receptor-like [Ylistrum balloti]|uniref:FMRFamide receptor-like n=1 Tax=Ylistrum balloti TaxID=509963 RepID=UPI002905CE78|nr:FMRFamide receptor-like [Ylistrum balloti]